MATQKSTGLATYLAVTGSIKAALDGKFIFIYSGTVPATADAALSGNTLLATVSVGDNGTTGLTFDGAPVSGVLVKTSSEAWSSTVVATATATFYRMAAAAPTAASTTDVRMQGTVGTTVLDDLVLTTTVLTTGNTQNIDQFQIS